MTYRHALVIGVALGVVAACVVWYLERFELNRLHGEVQQYLSNYDRFQDFLKQQRGEA